MSACSQNSSNLRLCDPLCPGWWAWFTNDQSNTCHLKNSLQGNQLSSRHVYATMCLIQSLCSPLCLGRYTLTGCVSLCCSLICRKMRQTGARLTANNELNADDEPDEEWLYLEMHQLEEMLHMWQDLLREHEEAISYRMRLRIVRLKKHVEKMRQLGSEEWHSQVRVGVA